MEKPVAVFSNANGNVFNLMAICSTALKSAGQRDRVSEMVDRVTKSKSYDDAIQVMMDYCEIE